MPKVTAFDEFVFEATFPDRDHVEIACRLEGDDEHDHQCAVFDFSYAGMHYVVVPYTVPGDLTVEVAMFNDAGEMAYRMTIAASGSTINPSDVESCG